MRRVADALNTGPASLYWHVGNKDGLLDLIFDEIIGEMDVPAPQGDRWKEQLREIALSQRATLLRHRDLAATSMRRTPMGPPARRSAERVGVLRAGGIPDD